MYGLDVPGNELELDADFSIDDRGTTTLTLDVDLRRSLREPENDGDDYRLVPSLRLINDDDAGAINGSSQASRIDSARAEERRGGEECGSTCRSRWARVH